MDQTPVDKKLAQAIEQLPEILKRDLEQNLCVCNSVAKITVIKAIVEGADELEKVKQQTFASDGTGCCKLQIKHLLNALVKNKA
ncbi:(2Fe-2S)-binding protein [Thiomicrospira microaerophila]|uniref:(2Fe-2S)-binding protein n=1 Tax=Thiomicrospira microaerophila TaxID=406020 RepID=UPI00200D40E4|nr:(2Fe-2S)-binding protein [Thiomicrospira microaerophila]UQB41808.1 (2Fe-2S)-binding protein [Thiomicrospira microaerophila]